MENKEIAQEVNFDKFSQEANEFIKQLASDLGHPEEENRAMIVLKSVMQAIRDRITISESFDLMAQLPIVLRGIYTHQWTYSEKPPQQYESIEEMKQVVEENQRSMGESEFDWNKPTEEIVSICIDSLKKYLSDGQLSHVRGQMPKEVKELIA